MGPEAISIMLSGTAFREGLHCRFLLIPLDKSGKGSTAGWGRDTSSSKGSERNHSNSEGSKSSASVGFSYTCILSSRFPFLTNQCPLIASAL